MNDFGGQCKSIAQLKVVETAVTEVGIRLAIQNLPNLKILKCNFSLQVVAQMFHAMGSSAVDHLHPDCGADVNPVRCLTLMNLLCNGGLYSIPFVKGAMVMAVQFCPFVVRVDICNIPGIIDEDLRALVNLKQLRRFSLEDVKCSFEKGLLPILEKFGPNTLERLELTEMTEVDVVAIVKNCPNLRCLSLIDIDRYIPQSSPQSSKLLSQYQPLSLERLEIDDGEGLSADDLSILLISSPSLVNLTLNFLDELTDQVIERAAIHHGFAKLQSLNLLDCQKLTKYAIFTILSLESPLTRILVSYNKKLKKKDVKEWKKMILDRNWDLSISGN